MEIKKDVLVIGAGVAGVSAAVYLARSKYSFAIVERELVGGKLNSISQIDNYPGFTPISGLDLIDNYKKQLNYLNVEITKDDIVAIKKTDEGFDAISDNNIYKVRAIIIATGSKNEKSNVPGEKEFLGKGISYCAVCDGFFNKGKDVVVFGKDVKACKEALYLEQLANKVYFVTDVDQDCCEGHFSDLIGSPKVEFLHPYEIVEYIGDFMGLTGVKLKNKNTNEERVINCYSVFPFIGETPSSYFLQTINLELNNGYIVVNSEQETNVEGVYAAGDIVSKSLKQVVTAGSDGAIAATNAVRYLNRRK